MFARSQMQCIARNIILNVREEVFVGRDAEIWRSVFPLNLKGAACVYVGESGEWSCLSFDLTIASDARQMTSGDQNDKPSKQTDPDLSHVKYFSVMMRHHRVLDSIKIQGGASPQSRADYISSVITA